VTLKVYGHVLPDDGYNYVKKLDELVDNRNIIESLDPRNLLYPPDMRFYC
jgi:hypothetical protein